MLVPLHAKSHYSLGYGVLSVPEIVDAAARRGLTALGLTDLETLAGQVAFHHACRRRGLRAITGVELRPRPGLEGRLVLLARDRTGYEALCRIVTRRRTARPAPEALATVAADTAGLHIMSDDPSPLEALLSMGVPRDALALLVVRPAVRDETRLLATARRLGLSIVADADALFDTPDDHALHALQARIRGRPAIETPERCLPEAAGSAFADLPDTIAATERIADACRLDLCDSRPVLPTLGDEPDGPKLARLCSARLDACTRGPEYAARLRRELGVIESLGFSGLFLLVAEIVEFARGRGIGVAARGSAASSLVAHLLGVSDVDPLAQGLLFERFLHVRRRDLPDIDVDVASHRREEVLDWVFRRHGNERAAMVGSIVAYRRRSAWRDGLKALGLPATDIERFSDRLPDDDLPELPVDTSTLPPRFREAAPLIERLIGRPHHMSVHPGGVVIADGPIERYAPLERAPKGVRVTQYDMTSLARLGLVKIDLLGNRCLSEIDETVGLLGRAPVMRDGDAATLETIGAGRTIGCFQIESPALRAVLTRFPVRGIGDLMSALAVVRPGPASGRAKTAFLRRARGEEEPEFWHPLVEECLRDAHGLLLYEEDIICAVARLTGWSLEEADAFRADVNRAGDDRSSLETRFRAAAPPEAADVAWRSIAAFSSYSFNKAHAAGVALLAWRCAWLKTHHPSAFGCAVLNHHGGLYPRRTLAADLQRAGVRILGPSLHASLRACTLEGGAIRVGLGLIKHLTRRTLSALLLARPFRDLDDLRARVPLTRAELEALVLSRACDELRPLAPGDYPTAHEALLAGRPGRSGLLPDTDRTRAWRSLVAIRNELRFLDMHLSDHPLRVLRPEAERLGCVRISGLPPRGPASISAVVAASRRVLSEDRAILQYVTFEDETGLVEAVLSPAAYERLRNPVAGPGPYVVSGMYDGERLHVDGVVPFHERPAPWAR